MSLFNRADLPRSGGGWSLLSYCKFNRVDCKWVSIFGKVQEVVLSLMVPVKLLRIYLGLTATLLRNSPRKVPK